MIFLNESQIAPLSSANRFDDFFRNKVSLSLKKSLFNYQLKKWTIAKHVPYTESILDIGSRTSPTSPDLQRTFVPNVSTEAKRHVKCASKVVTSITTTSCDLASVDCIVCSEVLDT